MDELNSTAFEVFRDATRSILNARIRSWLMCSTVLGCVAIVVPPVFVSPAVAQSARSQVVGLSIPSQPLASAVDAFSRATGWQVGYSSRLANVPTRAVSGMMAPQQALRAMVASTGINVRITGPTSAALTDSAAVSSAQSLDAGQAETLDPVNVTSRASSADAPYQSPGSVSYVSREDLDRVPPTSAGDMFRTAPGVISAGNRVGTSINPNIRGLQGMGRIATTVDGARQTSSSYRGYIGNRDETFIDPDMVGGVDISKGPSDGPGIGGIGGSVNFRTLEAADIVPNGKTFGARFKGSLGTAAVDPRAPDYIGNVNQIGTAPADERPSVFNGKSFSRSFALAQIKENYEFLAAYSKRVQGNYFVGTKVPSGIVFPTGNFFVDNGRANANVQPGAEAFNTSEDTDSFLVKGKAKWGDGQSLELSYLYYGSRFGEIDEISFVPAGFTPYGQFALSRTTVDTYTAKYRNKPSDNPYIDFRANLWFSDTNSERNQGSLAGPYGIGTLGGDIGNASVFTTPLGQLTVDGGLEFTREQARAQQFATPATGAGGWMTFGPSGTRLMAGAFGKATLQATDWLSLSGGGRFDRYESEGEGYLTRYPEKSGDRFSPNAGIVVTPIKGIQLYGQYKEGYRPPSLRETHWHYEGLLVVNPDLRPEIAKNREVGVNVLREDLLLAGDKLRLKFSYFDNHYDDYIIRALRSSRGGQNVYHWLNLASANYQGYEISGGYDAKSFFVEGAFTKYKKIEYCPTENTCAGPAALRQNLGAAATSVQQNDYATNYIPPEYTASLTAGIRLFDQKLTIGGRANAAATRFGSTWSPSGAAGQIGYGLPWPSYVTYDAFSSYKLNDGNVFSFSIENITDQYYFGALSSAGIPSPGRTARITYTATIDESNPVMKELAFGIPPKRQPSDDWTGFYLGGHLGYGLAGIQGTTTAGNGVSGGIPATESADIELQNLTKGFQLGFNYQFGNRVVVGIEGDISWTNMKETQEALTTQNAVARTRGFLQAKTSYEVDRLFSLRGRAGYAFDRAFIYATGGLAWLMEDEVRTQYQQNSPTDTSERFRELAHVTRNGWTWGGGAEYALAQHWSLKGEYLYARFGDEDFRFQSARSGVTTATYNVINGRSAANDLTLHTVKAGLNYRF